MNTGLATKSWSDAQQVSGLKGDSKQFVSANDKARMPAGEDLGNVLNKVADPNYIDPSKTRRAVGNQNLDKDAFFKLMLAQIKSQDPTSPMQSHEMAAHLAQFTSLEQLYNINSGIDGLKKSQDPMANFQVLNFMGKNITADGSKIHRVVGDKSHEMRFSLAEASSECKVSILDEKGKTIRSYLMPDLKKGENKLSWNGLMEDGNSARVGDYRIKIEAKDANGRKIAAQTAFGGKITGVNFTPQGPVLLVGAQTIRLSEITKIEDPSLESKSDSGVGPETAVAKMPKSSVDAKGLVENKFVAPAEEAPQSDMENVRMASETLVNALPKRLEPPEKELIETK